ncbi:hypothetical protein ACH5AO_35110 [Streptomyces sp. NPDC018964]|uniref:hypothetical protein n=1 Tax=unclassified Streptomyces TaxID=2593676 RepID=UPI0037A7E5D2
MIESLVVKGVLAVIRFIGYAYWFLWRSRTYVSYHDDIEPLDVPADASGGRISGGRTS